MTQLKKDSDVIKGILDSAYLARARENKFTTKKTFAPSTLGYGHGKCGSYWALAFTGAYFEEESDPAGQARMMYGSEAHARLQKMFMDSDFNVIEEMEIKNVDPPIRGFVDLVIDLSDDPEDQGIPIEIKTARFESYFHREATGKGMDYQVLQLLIYMRILKKTKGYLLYENKNDQTYSVIEVLISEKNKEYVEYLFNWMREVYDAFLSGEFPTRAFKEGSKVCEACPVRKACWGEERVETREIKRLVLPTP